MSTPTMNKRHFLGLMAASSLTWLGGCGGAEDEDGSVRARLLNVNPATGSVNLVVDDDTEASSVAYGTTSGYASVSSSSVDVVVNASSSGTSLVEKTINLSSDSYYTLVLHGWGGGESVLSYFLEDDDDIPTSSSKSALGVMNAQVEGDALDVYLTGVDETLSDDSSTFIAALATSTRKAPTSLSAGTYRLWVTPEGDTATVLLTTTVTLKAKTAYTLVLAPANSSSGVLLNGYLVPQKGTMTAMANTQARVRVASAISGNGTVALSVGDTVLQAATKSPLLADYQQVTAGEVSVVATVNGTVLAAQTLTLEAGADVTLLVCGSSADDATVTALADKNRLPASSKFKLRVIHAVPSLSTESMTMSIDGVSSGTSAIAYREASDYVLRASGSDKSVIVETQTATIYSDDTDDFTSEGVYTAFIWQRPTTADANAIQVKFYADR